MTKIIAHRGASAYYPENTMEAFEEAIKQQADGFELDVHLTKDGQIVVTHDATLERVSDGKGRVVDHTLEELRQLDFSKPFPDKGPCRIPTLADVYELAAPYGILVNVELKTGRPIYPEMPQKLLELTSAYKMEDLVLYSSFNHYALQEIKKRKPSAQIGLLYDCGLVDPWVYANYIGADAIHPHYSILMALPQTLESCQKAGVMVNTWTVDEAEVMSQLFSLGLDALITNKPDVANAVKQG